MMQPLLLSFSACPRHRWLPPEKFQFVVHGAEAAVEANEPRNWPVLSMEVSSRQLLFSAKFGVVLFLSVTCAWPGMFAQEQ